MYIVGISDYSDLDNESEYCSISSKYIQNNNNNNDRLTAFDPGQPG